MTEQVLISMTSDELRDLMAVTGRDQLYSDEVETIKKEYYGLRNRKQ